MDDAEFWTLIARIDADALREGDSEAAVEPLVDALTPLGEERLHAFEEALARKLYALDGRRYAEHAGESGESADGFLYLRCFVVAAGRAEYEAVLRDPSRMPSSPERWCEDLLAVAALAYEASTGRDNWIHDASVSYETGSNADAWKPG
jgi:hypothetical protein